MTTPDVEVLTRLVAKSLKRTKLTPVERREVLHIARGLASKDSARIERVPVETIRTRRKQIYRKLRLSGAGAVISRLLALALGMIAKGERLRG